MPNIDLIRTNDGLPGIPDMEGMSDSEKIDTLNETIKMQRDYIVRLKEQIGYELSVLKRSD